MNARILITTILCAAIASVAALAAPSTGLAAKTPCWKELINDWYDGRIDRTYPAHCYREAQKHIPEDARVYSSLEEDLQRALASVASRGEPPTPNTPVRPVPGTGRRPDGESSPGDQDERSGRTTEAFGSDDKGPVLGRDFFAPANADSIPIPLLVLASLAVLLLLAALGSFLARRLQARRVPVSASNRTPPPRS